MNKLFQELNPSPQLPNNIGNIKKMMQMVKGMSNPSQAINTLMEQNPQLKEVMSMVQNSKMSPKDLFYKMAKEQGVDPETILSQLR